MHKITLPTRVEDWTPHHLEHLWSCIQRDEPFDVLDAYVVGSHVFGRDEVGDLDLVLVVSKADFDVAKQHGDYAQIRRAGWLRIALQQLTGLRVETFYTNPDRWPARQVTADGDPIPYYDLRTGSLYHKAPGVHLPGTYRMRGNAFYWVPEKPARLQTNTLTRADLMRRRRQR